MNQESIFVDNQRQSGSCFLKQDSTTLGALNEKLNRSKDRNPFDMIRTEQTIDSDSDDELNGGRSVIQEVDYSDPKKAS